MKNDVGQETIVRYQYSVGPLIPVLTGDLEKCFMSTFSMRRAKEFIAGLSPPSFLNVPYVPGVMGVYSIPLEKEAFEKRPELNRLFYPDTHQSGGILDSREIKDEIDDLFRYKFVRRSEGINPSLVTVVFNPDLPTGTVIYSLAVDKFGVEAVQDIEIRPYKRMHLEGHSD